MILTDELPCKTEDPELWFGRVGSKQSRQAKRLCFQDCPLMFACQEYALREGIPYGVFGAMDERDRELVWQREGGRPTRFLEVIDDAVRPLLQERRDRENMDGEAA